MSALVHTPDAGTPVRPKQPAAGSTLALLTKHLEHYHASRSAWDLARDDRERTLEEIIRLRNHLAIDFGSRRGWLLAEDRFTPLALASRSLEIGEYSASWWSTDGDAQHIFCYRTVDGR